jgi:hypothetical protein
MSDRKILPQRRACETFYIRHGKQKASNVTLGRYSDGSVGEVFISAAAQVGSEVDLVARDGAVLVSLALQYGIPLETMQRAITREADGSPATIIGAVIDKLSEEAKCSSAS